MTCIAAFVEGDVVWMGADSAGVGGYSLTVRADRKMFKNGPMLFGCTSSFRMIQLLRWAMHVPDHDPRHDVEKYMATTFMDAARDCFKKNGFGRTKEGEEAGGTFLVAYKGRLFCVYDDYQVQIPLDNFDAVGCGHDIAKGALYATGHLKGRDRMMVALEAAERYSAGVRGPFHIDYLEMNT